MNSITADINYLAPLDGPAIHHIFPQSTGRETQRPANESCPMPIRDGRVEDNINLDIAGFALAKQATAFNAFFSDAEAIRSEYYAECTEFIMANTGASYVIAFDHNLRSKAKSEAGAANMNEPVRFCHNDYTDESGPIRLKKLLNNENPLPSQRFAFINLWRPLMEPVQDKPLALCVASTVDKSDLVATEIRHYKDEHLDEPAHRGEIYSVLHNPQHQWVYFPDMREDEVLFIKCYDSAKDGRARFTPHTAIDLPTWTENIPARESIEVRTVAFFD